jgi:hypothetical protein
MFPERGAAPAPGIDGNFFSFTSLMHLARLVINIERRDGTDST